MPKRTDISSIMIIGAGPGVNENALELEIYGLPVRIDQKPDGKLFTSVWLPTPEELALLNEGGAVVLECYHGQPPVSVNAAMMEILP